MKLKVTVCLLIQLNNICFYYVKLAFRCERTVLLCWPSGTASTWRAGDTGTEPCFPLVSHASDLNTGSLVATMPGAWQDRVSIRTGQPGVYTVSQ